VIGKGYDSRRGAAIAMHAAVKSGTVFATSPPKLGERASCCVTDELLSHGYSRIAALGLAASLALTTAD